VPLRTICWLLLAIVAGSTIGFKVALPGSDSAPVPVASATPNATQAPLAFAPPRGRRVTPIGLDTGGPSSPGLRPLSGTAGRTVATYGSRANAASAADVTFNSPYVSDLRFLALPGVMTAPPASSSPSETRPRPPSIGGGSAAGALAESASATDCVGAFRRLRVDRERAAVQDEIDRLQERSEITDGALVALWERKKELLRRLEELN